MTNPVRRTLTRLLPDTGYLLLGLPLAVLSFVVLVTGLAFGAGMLVTVVGLPVLVGTLYAARVFADLERVQLRSVVGEPAAPRPEYRRAAPGAGWFRRMIFPLGQAQYWLDLAHGLFSLVPAVVGFVLAVTWWSLTLGGLTWWYWGRFLPPDGENVFVTYVMGADTPRNETLLYLLLGLVALLTLPFVIRGAALARAGFARALLLGLARMQERIDVLAGQQAAAVSAEATALRRLERDLHDGPQQHLVRLSMELARARRQVGSDPEQARTTLTEALALTRETLDELRALSRGIAPPVLVDRGLPAALAALAGRCTVPVELSVDVPGRPDPAVENAAYFVVAEALANVAKHSRATGAVVVVAVRSGRLVVTVRDDGVGGASVAKGHGLAGLTDRVRAIGGTLAVRSPAGGPTEIVADLPCG